MLATKSKQPGFTIVELLIVIIVIALLATLVITTYNGVQKRAADTKRSADLSQLYKAILVARENTGQTLLQIDGTGCSSCYCSLVNNNPDALEPRQLSKSHVCWTIYRQSIARIASAADTNLDPLKDGDGRGNPYFIDENEGEGASTNCGKDILGYYKGNGISFSQWKTVPLFSSACL